MYRLDQHLLVNKIKEEEKYKTVLLLLIVSKDKNTHPEKTPASSCVREGVYTYIYPTKKVNQPVLL